MRTLDSAFSLLESLGYGRDDGRARPIRASRPADHAPVVRSKPHPCASCKAPLRRCVTCPLGKKGDGE